MDASDRRTLDRPWVAAFLVLLALFVFRIVAQLVQLFAPTPLLPPFEIWQSGLLPYPALVASQLAIVAVSLAFARSVWIGALRRRRRLGWTLLALGGIYFLGAAFRLIAGVTFLSDVSFFARSVPSFFHIVLASMVLIAARLHLRASAPSS